MSVDVTIKNKKLLKKELKVKDFIFDGMRYGIMDDAYRLDEGKIGECTIVFNSKHLCRGYELSCSKNCVNLRLLIPTSDEDIRFFYDYVRKICEKLNAKDFLKDGVKVSLEDISTHIESDMCFSKNSLHAMGQDVIKDKYKITYLFGVCNPICFGKDELEKVGDQIDKLGAFMHELQVQDLYYAKPRVYARNDDTLFGMYVLTEGVKSIFPDEAKLFMANEKLKVTDWYVSFVIDNNVAGTIFYQDFLENVKKNQRYDAEHFVLTMKRKKMEELLQQYKTMP